MNLLKKIFEKKEKPLPTHTVDELKEIVDILFVDDTAVKKAEQLKNDEGWKKVTKINDVSALAQQEVKRAHIIFVDIQGVGKTMGFKDEGLGLIVALKKTYPEKNIVMYSAESHGNIDAFHEAASLVDGRLRKDADLYEFASTTEELAKEAFCFNNCVLHICDVLKKELKVEKTHTEVEQIVKRIYNEKLYTDESLIRDAFSLSNIGSVASIIQLLFGKSL